LGNLFVIRNKRRAAGKGENDKKYNEDNNNLTEKKIDTRTRCSQCVELALLLVMTNFPEPLKKYR
jgi:ribosomal protein L44E